ncbi:unnamed protein product [Brachionus calyciflorus]|uniref:UDP-N-acetylglucosamine diphosphorylase n=1 Tax=Brachionus calyciflorus TaxID=104777 RepID=A0A813ZKT1_9BILA|nr:unnamed protein product [Brachionus calyciflorus]
MNKQDLINLLEPYGQEHLLKYWEELNQTEKEHLIEDIKEIDFAQMVKNYNRVKSEMDQTVQEFDELMQPVPQELKGSYEKSTPEQIKEYEMLGLKAIANNEVASLLLAGGQGTRLGVNYPKGMYSVGLFSGKSLYHLQGERLVKLKQYANRLFPEAPSEKQNSSIPWYIMTSEHTQESTIEYFRKSNFFGLDKENIKFFEQFMLPCLTNDGKVILDQKSKISKAPDGNGGLYRALDKRSILNDMKKRGVKYVHVYCVDNILVKMADPAFVGFCIAKNANCAAKVVKKVEPDEKVGVICKVKDRFQVVEYSEISEKTRNLRTDDGELLYNAGNICNHFFNIDFLSELCSEHESELKHHVAHKKIAYVNENGERVTPKETNGIKLEKFVFDVFPFSTNFAIWEVYREEEFSPLKNSDDCKKETPTTCRNDLYAQHARWLQKAGAVLDPEAQVEISPLVSTNGEELTELMKGKALKGNLTIELDKSDNKVKINGSLSL